MGGWAGGWVGWSLCDHPPRPWLPTHSTLALRSHHTPRPARRGGPPIPLPRERGGGAAAPAHKAGSGSSTSHTRLAVVAALHTRDTKSGSVVYCILLYCAFSHFAFFYVYSPSQLPIANTTAPHTRRTRTHKHYKTTTKTIQNIQTHTTNPTNTQNTKLYKEYIKLIIKCKNNTETYKHIQETCKLFI